MVLRPNLGRRNGRSLRHIAQGLIGVLRLGVNGAVIHGIDDGGGGRNGGQDVLLLHALPDGPGDILREQHGGIHGPEELLHGRRTGPLCLDAEALQLPLEGIGALQGRAPIVFAGVQGFQHLGKGLALLAVHSLFQSQIVIAHVRFLLTAKQ